MRVRQEQLVFVGVLAILGTLFLRRSDEPRGLRGAKRGEASAEAPPTQAVPDVALVLPNGERLAGERELFVPPSDTHPLPPLELEEPPREELVALLPLCDPGPAPRAFGLLRTRLVVRDVPGLFDASVAGTNGEGAEDKAELQGDVVQEKETRRDARESGSPARDPARAASYRARYDWLVRRSGTTVYGRIVNEDRYGLATDSARVEEAVLFVQVDPETGRDIHASVGAPAIAFPREELQSFGFAETPANEIELQRRRLGEIDSASFATALSLAERCLEVRREAPRALDLAEELARACAALDPAAAEPGRLLARVQAERFEFEQALRTLEELALEHPSDVETQVELARIEERFLLEESAEERLRRATGLVDGTWRARWALGRFLLARDRAEEALAELERAALEVPQDPAALALRVAVRTDLGACALALGDVAEAARVLAQTLSADPTQERALAGLRAARLYGAAREPGDGPDLAAAADGGSGTSGFELALVAGLEALVAGRHEASLELLRQAREADPLREHRALAALSRLAEASGHSEQALSFVQQALEHTPDDVWCLYQRGRLLLGSDDPEGAHESFQAALAAEPLFADALVGLGETAFRRGDFESAELYLERAVALGLERAGVWALRGWNALRLGSSAAARESFERATALAADDPTARAGLAWCTYLEGQEEEARVQLAELDRARRELPEDDAWRTWARAQIARMTEHAAREEWVDDFERLELRNGWTVREGAGPLVTLQDGAVHVQGVFAQEGRVSVFREYPAGSFVSFEISVWIDAETTVQAGLFVARERARQDARDTLAEVALARHQDGALELSFARKGVEPETVELPEPFPIGRWVRLRVERTGDPSDARVTLSMDGIVLIENAAFSALGSTASPLQAGVFAQGQPGRRVGLRLDDAAVVYRR